MKTFKQYTKTKDLKAENIDLDFRDIDVGVHQFEYHITALLTDLLELMWKATKFLVIVGGGFIIKALYNRYNKEAREHRRQLKLINKAIEKERTAKTKGLMLAAYTKAADMAEAEKKMLSKLSPEQQKKYKKDIEDLETGYDKVIRLSKDAIKAIKTKLK